MINLFLLSQIETKPAQAPSERKLFPAEPPYLCRVFINNFQFSSLDV